ncbi:MAG: branched-chain amino acid ABC transporter permease [Acidimicrobiales bacterium]
MSFLEPLALDPLPEQQPPEVMVRSRARMVVVRDSRRWKMLVLGALTVPLLVISVAPFFLPVVEGRLVSRFVALGVALVGLQFVVGLSGQLSLCHGVFVGLGSYATTIVISRFGWSHAAGLALTPLVGFGAGCIVGLLALRIRATYLGPVTLSVAVTFPMLVKRFSWFTGGSGGLPLVRQINPPDWMHLRPGQEYKFNHLLIVMVAVLALVVARNVVLSPVGLAVRAVAENPLSAATSGINVRRTRVLAYGWGAAFGALGGGLLVLDTPVVGADNYDLFRSLGYYAAVTVGGAVSMIGAVFGAGLLIGVPWFIDTYGLRASPNLILGTLLVGAILVAPGGLAVAVANYVNGLIDVRPAQGLGDGGDPNAGFAPRPTPGAATASAEEDHGLFQPPEAHYRSPDERHP